MTAALAAEKAIYEYAGTVAYLASDDSGFVTGSSFPANGGIAPVTVDVRFVVSDGDEGH